MAIPESQKRTDLKKVLGVTFGIAVLVGGTIGSGILRNPGTIAEILNNYWLIIACWVFGGIYVLIAVGSYAELGTMLPKAGGAYNYVKRAFGNYAGFLSSASMATASFLSLSVTTSPASCVLNSMVTLL